mmetsp:Transcript_13472/g.18454  ORF Transcript_13472/g.18454 Transcript_13472/m.18454 type:complete len:272 (-) Transcript_13472:360-1175(-)|eukprot:CAMPEP_0196581664 /NCGR_PEP_ID=MMETSP1081-20130531/34878_1 /TAXON_ID=36882 /ORGANISM="Pyramimonas amylifera, Strain CCMP720" /LENGTH=271 /DNA_ID=CAMNT_0041901979 /DNA_START=687 /DNA_END=1502 /DNA_ORIENTATION=-
MHSKAGFLDGHFHVELLLRLHPQHKLIRPLSFFTRKQVSGDVSELNTDFRPALVETFSRLQNERYPVPAFVVDPENHHAERGCAGPRGKGLHLLLVRLLAVPLGVLGNDDVLLPDFLNAPQDLELLISDVLLAECGRLVHGNQGHQLQQVVLHDVPDDALRVKVLGLLAGNLNGLLHDDLDVLDVFSVPDGGEEPVGKPHHQQILYDLFTQVAVHSVQLILCELPLHAFTHRHRTHCVATERFFQNQSVETGVAHTLQFNQLANMRPHGER